ncbi:hypothetical protein [Saccharothrix lopnurensis]|uniref:Uncharacterized protein n=1 Tax=Saccharothrix lopnurensis TaxID=1670621 RepID=A0ABW1PHV5_9PSEU
MKEMLWGIGGIMGGFALSVLWWYFVTHVLAPSLNFSKQVGRLTSVEGRSVYRIKVKNVGRRAVIDLTVSVTMHFRGISLYQDKEAGNNLVQFDIPVSVPYSVYLRPGRNRILRIDFSEAMNEFSRGESTSTGRLLVKSLYPVESQWISVTFESLLRQSRGSYFTASVLCYDEWSGARKVFISPSYGVDDIVPGVFNELDIKPDIPK